MANPSYFPNQDRTSIPKRLSGRKELFLDRASNAKSYLNNLGSNMISRLDPFGTV